MKRILLSACGLTVCLLLPWPHPTWGQVEPTAGMMRFPDISKDQIVFSYADDLWLVERGGGRAWPLASPPGAERFPRFSPDGKTIAFMGSYDDGSDLYTIAIGGGLAERWTYHPAVEMLCDWTPDGNSLIFASNGFAGLERQHQLFTISREAPYPQPFPIPYGTNGAISGDNKWLAYTPHSRDHRTWKRYRGGMASDIWLFNLEERTSKQMTDFDGTDTIPMWHGKTVYYLSDAGPEHRLNIWSYNTQNGERQQVTEFGDNDCKWPAIGPGQQDEGEIVFTNGSRMYVLNLQSQQSTHVSVTIPGDQPQLRKQKIDASKFVQSVGISPTGQRVTLDARGDIWTAPAKHGFPRNLTRTDESAERYPAWSPDGRWIAYLSDATGEYEIYLTQSDGRGETKQLTTDGNGYRYLEAWSPDSKYLTYSDKTGALFVLEIETGDSKLVDTDPFAQRIQPNWSHDSVWLGYAKATDTRTSSSHLWVYHVKHGTRRQLTSGFFRDTRPTFDRSGRYIFFASNRSFNAPKYDDVGSTFIYSGTEVLLAMPLREDIDDPFGVKSDEETWKDHSKNTEKQDEPSEPESKSTEDVPAEESISVNPSPEKPEQEKRANGKQDTVKKPVTFDFERIERRVFQLPIPPANFGTLAVNDQEHLIFATTASRGSDGGEAIKIFDFKDEKQEVTSVVDGTSKFEISADGKKLLVLQGEKAYVINAAVDQKLADEVNRGGMTVMVDPRQEWKQIFWEAWRLQRDFFYDPFMHGVDWKGIGQHYECMLADCVSRRDVGFVIGEMISELNVGHAYYRSSPEENTDTGKVGLLGCRFQADGQRYKIVDLYEGADWESDARNPLRRAGAQAGQYLLEINGQTLQTDINPYQLLEGTAGMTISLTLSDDAVLDDDDQRILIQPLSDDTHLRFRSWIEQNRQYVDQKTDGKVGYIYVVNTGIPGQNDLVRQLYGQFNKEALIVDDRWNGGGQIPTRFIELLNRPLTSYWARRDGRDWAWPPDAHFGPKCMLINGMAGSGGDMFPALFRQLGLGKLIGMCTWGGLVGITGSPPLVDGASVTVPSFAYHKTDGTWGIEGHGVDPDIKVIDDPAQMVGGRDPQLDEAIALMLNELATAAYQPPPRPAYPDRSKMGIPPQDR